MSRFAWLFIIFLLLSALVYSALQMLSTGDAPKPASAAVKPMPEISPSDASPIVTTDKGYHVDWPSVVHHFPADFPPSPLLRKFAEWAAQHPADTAGFFSVMGDRMEDHWIEDGSDLAERFPAFLRLPEGSTIGYWRRDDGRSPIVLTGSEGQLELLADDLPEFLNRLGRASTLDHKGNLPSELSRDADDEDQASRPDNRPELIQWLRQNKHWMSDEELARRSATRETEAKALAKGEGQTADESNNPLKAFLLQQWQPARVAAQKQSKELSELFILLRPYWPKPKSEAWENESVEVIWVGEQMTMSRFRGSRWVPVPEAERARPLLGSLREASRKSNPARGLWQSATLNLYTDKAVLVRNYQRRPNRRLHQFTDAELIRDAASQGRNAYWGLVLEPD